jgi:hypothetical protein
LRYLNFDVKYGMRDMGCHPAYAGSMQLVAIAAYASTKISSR